MVVANQQLDDKIMQINIAEVVGRLIYHQASSGVLFLIPAAKKERTPDCRLIKLTKGKSE